jgi:hypothetical protein
MSLAQDFEENVVDLYFFKPTSSVGAGGIKKSGYSQAFDVKKGIFQMAKGTMSYTPNGVIQQTTNDAFADKDDDTDDMYSKIKTLNEVWWLWYDGIFYSIKSIEAAGEREDPYIMGVIEVKKGALDSV